MWTLAKEFRFEASHQLSEHDGKCSRLHGHSWVGTVLVAGDRLFESGPKQGMVMDYADISVALGPILEHHLDHWHLNDTLDVYPTSEVIAKWLFDHLQRFLPSLIGIIIEETCTARCVYIPDLSAVPREEAARMLAPESNV